MDTTNTRGLPREAWPVRRHPRRKSPPRFRVPSPFTRFVSMADRLAILCAVTGESRFNALRNEAWAIFYRYDAVDAVAFLERNHAD